MGPCSRRPGLVVSHNTCPPLSSSPHSHSFLLAAVINTHGRCQPCANLGLARRPSSRGGQARAAARLGQCLPHPSPLPPAARFPLGLAPFSQSSGPCVWHSVFIDYQHGIATPFYARLLSGAISRLWVWRLEAAAVRAWTGAGDRVSTGCGGRCPLSD
jgi:hypothetical protein